MTVADQTVRVERVNVTDDFLGWQADCDACGWHTRATTDREWAYDMADLHRERCSSARDDYGRNLLRHLRHIANNCAHTPSLTEDDHIHEPTTGGERWCAPCYAWRVLNGSPDAYAKKEG